MSDKQIIFSMHRVSKSYPGRKTVIKDISLSFFYGAKIGVLGTNGSGKSTLLRMIAGVDEDFQGDVSRSRNFTTGLLEQEPALDPNKTVKEIVEEGAQETVELLKKFEEISAKFSEPMSDDEMNKLLDKQAKLQDTLDATNAWDLDSRLQMAMSSLKCPPADQKVGTLSGGEKRRVALCRLLLKAPDVLLLDEPTNHLDAETVAWLEKHLAEYPGTIIAVTHDRYFLDNVAGWILELDRGQGVPFEGNYTNWLEQKTKRMAVEQKHQDKRRKALEGELEWIKSSPKARQSKSKARISNYATLRDELEKSQRKGNETSEIFIPLGPKLGKQVLKAESIAKSFGERSLYSDLSFEIPPGAVVGIIGANGMGKTTLFKLITGQETVDSGTFEVGQTVKMAYVDQGRELPGDQTIFEVISDNSDIIKLGEREVNSRSYIAKFNFSGDDHSKKVSDLSGGERNRVHLARILKEESNLLLLDEPTNDLDVHTLRALENAIDKYAGSVVVISHDRYFLDRIATHILAFEAPGQVHWHDGNFTSYHEDYLSRHGLDKERTYKSSHAKLTRV